MTNLVLCATRRLERSLRLSAAPGAAVPTAHTIDGWLDTLFDEALLRGELTGADAPARLLSPLAERLVWRQVITRALGKDGSAALFDLDGLAAAAREAHSLMENWALSAAAVQLAGQEEAAAFLQWRHAYLRQCERAHWRDEARQRAWRIELLARGLGRLPAQVTLAGFDRFNPLERRLLDVLAARGVAITESPSVSTTAQAQVLSCADAETEYRALAEWLRASLAARPNARLGVVVPDLAAARPLLTRLLDDALCPEARDPDGAGHGDPRPYNLSLGRGLDTFPLVADALSLLRLLVNPREIDQARLGELLASPYWSASETEADGRARLDAACRARLGATVALDRWIAFAESRLQRLGEAAPRRTLRHLDVLRKAAGQTRGRRLPGAWGALFAETLKITGWPGERAISSHDFQARQAFAGVLDALRQFDPVSGEIPFAEAVALLTDACAEQVFQPKTEGTPPVQVLGLLEAAGETFDALWVSGMLAGVWPPPARPNPLLPAALQRAVGSPNASPEAQREFAIGIHARLLAAAPAVIFSWPRRDGERELQRSPLLDGLSPMSPTPSFRARPGIQAADTAPEPDQFNDLGSGVRRNDEEPSLLPPPSAIEQARRAQVDAIELIADHQAPAVDGADAARHLKGGTALLKAQAICPAAAFYQYRLGAEKLETPLDGLDPRARGSLLHLVLEHFWRGRDSATLQDWTDDERRLAIDAAVTAGLADFENGDPSANGAGAHGPLPARFRAIESRRVAHLVEAWLQVEKARGEAFTVIACEEAHELELDGIAARVVIDRIDELPDGRRLVIDYKTGARVDARSWAAARIAEPQLPIYAVFAVNPHPLAGAAFAQVRGDKLGFVGVTATPGLLPKVKTLAESRKRFPEASFPDWEALLRHWRSALLATAAEIKAGDARVVFTREGDLTNSPVLPLLRLAERRRQYEAG